MSTIFKESSDTYNAMKKTLDHVMSLKEEIIELFKNNPEKKLFLTGCGTSFYQLRSLESILALNTGYRTMTVPSGDALLNFDRYKKYLNDSIVITVSRTGLKGETIDLFNQIKKETNAKIFGIVCSAKSKLKEIADYVIELPWSYDTWASQTRSIANHAAAYTAIFAFMKDRQDIIDDLYLLAEKGSKYIERILPICKKIGKSNITNAMVISDSESCGLAETGALMFDEIPFINAQYRHVMDALHGPQCSLNKNSLVLALLNKENTDKQINIIKRLQDRTKHVVVFKDKGSSNISGLMDEVIFGEDLCPEVIGIPFLTLLLYSSYFLGVENCLIADIDQDDFVVGHIHGVKY